MSDSLTEAKKRLALSEIDMLLAEAKQRLHQAAALAEEHCVAFRWEFHRNMDAWYEPASTWRPDDHDSWDEPGWQPSAGGC